MNEREKVIQALEIHLKPNSRCVGCPYPNNGLCGDQLYRDALTLLKAQEPKTAYWIHCNGKSHIFYCSNCAEKVSYNNAHRVYNKNMKPIEQVNKFCRGCGYKMIPRPTDEQREAVKWDADSAY